tara:strand:- start:588 stop:959 length:372 start_codon:yes stop_codon:yes gene_type:complete
MSLELGFMYLIGLGRDEVSWANFDPSPQPYYPPKPEGSTIPCLPDGTINPDFYGPPAPVSLGGCGPENPIVQDQGEPEVQNFPYESGSITIFDWSIPPSGPATYKPKPLEYYESDVYNLLLGS